MLFSRGEVDDGELCDMMQCIPAIIDLLIFPLFPVLLQANQIYHLPSYRIPRLWPVTR